MKRRVMRFVFCVFLCAGVLPSAPAAEGLSLPLKITVEAGKHPVQDAAVSIALPTASNKARSLTLIETTGGTSKPIPIQLEPAESPCFCHWIVAGKIPSGGKRSFELRAGAPVKITEISVNRQPQYLEVRQGKTPVLRYNSAHVEPPKGADAKYGRSAHIHPLWTPAGKIVTDEFPPDHMHQSGIFLAYTKTEFEGRQPNFWDLQGGTGRVRFKKVLSTTSGPVFGGFLVDHEHVDLTVPKGKVALNENWDVRVWNVGGSKPTYWIIDITSRIHCATESPLKLPKYHYGGMAIRGARSWDPKRSHFVTAEGKDRLAGNHTRTRWCDLSGDVEGTQAGVTFMTHPTNFRFPEPLRIHPTMPYMVYCPSHLGDWEFKSRHPREKKLVFEYARRYRFLVHDGKLNAEEAERIWHAFAEPPLVRIENAEKPRVRRLIYNSDADNMFVYAKPPMNPADVYPYVDEIVHAGATTLFMCPNYGMVMNYPSKVTEMIGTGMTPAQAKQIDDVGHKKSGTLERGAVNFRELVKAGHDPLGIVIDRARQKKLEVFITFRLNECHCVDTPNAMPEGLLISKAWREHPEWHIGKVGDKLSKVYQQIIGPRVSPVVSTWLPGGFNFALPEVRKLRLAEIRECCERYPIDGLDLDFQRFPMYFRQGEEKANIETMTAFIREVRQMTRDIGKKRGRTMLLSVRIMARPEQNLAIGLDPAGWAKEVLLDFVTVSHYLRNDFALPVADYRKLLPEKMPLYGSIEVEDKPNEYRRIARRLWKDHVDGIMVFNFFTTREGGKEPPFEILKEIGDQAKLRADEE